MQKKDRKRVIINQIQNVYGQYLGCLPQKLAYVHLAVPLHPHPYPDQGADDEGEEGHELEDEGLGAAQEADVGEVAEAHLFRNIFFKKK